MFFLDSGVAEQPFYNTGDEETTDDAIRYIWNRTGIVTSLLWYSYTVVNILSFKYFYSN